MPIGELSKPEVRAQAAKMGLATADKKTARASVLWAKWALKDFVGGAGAAKPGNLLDQRGKVIGQHDGALFIPLASVVVWAWRRLAVPCHRQRHGAQ